MNDWLLPLTLASSLLAGLIIFFLPERSVGWRSALNLGAAVLKLACVAAMLWGTQQGISYELRLPFLPGHELLLRADPLGLLFVTLSAVLWLLTTVYAIGYLEHSPNRSRFFGFFSLCVTATVGIALSGNLLTFFLFYELLTLATYPLVVHRGTPQVLQAGARYLAYTLGGGVVLLAAIVWLQTLVGPVEFRSGGALVALEATAGVENWMLVGIFALFIAGLGVKAAIAPLHGWLPQAMVAPAPVSALLHAVAVVKAGAFGIVRVVYEVFGIEFAHNLGVLLPLAVVASVTIVFGSLRALTQDDLKRRLAYSTVSQVSYIVLGVALFGPAGTIGGLVHLVHQGIMKITLFFCAGNYAETLGVHRISQMAGIGQRMPWTTAAFTVGALGMIGVPPVAGFISKWYLGLGAIEAGLGWVLAVLLFSSLLNAAYFLPILRLAWFEAPPPSWPHEAHAAHAAHAAHEAQPDNPPHAHPTAPDSAPPPRTGDAAPLLLLPTLCAAALALLAGLAAGVPLSPLDWVRFITATEYLP
ncbi:complex I subunit 5 family protein [Serpentinimonas maccroryi]|uniref:complex I subunit 5 family protein n=1 Tax=Serpentinimonas maccroryi TaxID=1458426 RepID=UPI0020334C2C|nr:monovalent cation/H+ antiporter subunit D family protein [Serpentinimonas maccroryi]MCM2478409.1 monovalent cation/H+ antiporter subunit D family protein [Serpentinimonas maccroryi]